MKEGQLVQLGVSGRKPITGDACVEGSERRLRIRDRKMWDKCIPREQHE